MSPDIVTLIVGLVGGSTVATIVVALLNRRKTAAEAGSIEAAASLAVEGARVERSLAVLEAVLEGVKSELKGQRELREQDRKDFTSEVTVWRERSAQCDERLSAEIRAREHEKVLGRERDVTITDLKRELILATLEVARLAKRAEEEDRRARDVVAATAAADLLRQAGIGVEDRRKRPTNGDLKDSVAALHDEVADVKREVTTGNASTLAQLADAQESRRISDIPTDDRSHDEAEHLADVPVSVPVEEILSGIARIEAASEQVATDLSDAHARADAVDGSPGEAADAFTRGTPAKNGGTEETE